MSKQELGCQKKWALCSTQGALKVGQVKSLSLLMKSLCTRPHTCTVSITTARQDGKSRQRWSSQQTHGRSRCGSVMLLIYITNRSETHQLRMSWVLRLDTYLYEDYLRKFLSNSLQDNLCIYVFMHGFLRSFPSQEFIYLFAYKYFCCSQAHFGLKVCSHAHCE